MESVQNHVLNEIERRVAKAEREAIVQTDYANTGTILILPRGMGPRTALFRIDYNVQKENITLKMWETWPDGLVIEARGEYGSPTFTAGFHRIINHITSRTGATT